MSAPTREVSRTLRDALFETLTSILSPVHDVRSSAEQQINVLEVTDEFAVHLTELVLEPTAPLAIRQLASVLLRQYVESHWSNIAEKFHPPETTSEAKAAIRSMLPRGLHESISKLRSSIAYAISTIANWDFPDEWPELFPILMQSLTSENGFAVHGAMRVLKEISCDVTEDQMPKFAPLVLPEMLKVFVQDQKYSIRTRGRAVEIFSNLIEMIYTTDSHKRVAKPPHTDILEPFTEALVSALKTPDGMTSDSGLKKDVLTALTNLIKFYPEQMSNWIAYILPPVWNALTESANLYIQTTVNDSEEINNPVDSDGEVLGFENFIFSIFEFVTVLVECSLLKNHVKKGLKDLLHYILLYTQITEEQIKVWTMNPDQFVEDEDDDSYAYTVRIAAQDLLANLGEEFEGSISASLCEAIVQQMEKLDKSNPYWWKIPEACMLSLGTLKVYIMEQLKEHNLQFDIVGFLHSIVLDDMNLSVSPFLYGRCLLFASKYSALLNDDILKRFLQATVNGLSESQTSIYISAVRAIYGFCDDLKKTQRVHLILPFLPAVMEHLIQLAIHNISEVLNLVLEAIAVVITVDGAFTAQVESRVSPITIAVFLKHHSDPVLVTLAQAIFKVLCQNGLCQGALQQRLLPTLVSVLQAAPPKLPSGLQAVCLEILETLVRHSPRPLPEPLVAQAFPAALHCILHAEDNSVLQNGGECLRAYVSVALPQVSTWQDGSNRSGLDYIVSVIQLLLDPKTPESASAFVGRLISLLITNAGSTLGDKSELLLRAVLSKMQQATALSVTENLVMVFAHLVAHQLEPVLDFLSGIPGPTGQSALQFVLGKWCEAHIFFYGHYERKVSTYSLSKILQFGLQGNDPRLQSILVKGDQVFNFNEGPKTRSKALHNPDEWTQIPLFVKIFKILLYELFSVLELEDDTSFEDEQETNGEEASKASYLYSLISEAVTSDYERDELEDDPDVVSNPIYTLNMKSYLTEYLQQLVQHPFYGSVSPSLTAEDKRVLAALTPI